MDSKRHGSVSGLEEEESKKGVRQGKEHEWRVKRKTPECSERAHVSVKEDDRRSVEESVVVGLLREGSDWRIRFSDS